MDEILLARIFQHYGEIVAAQARIEAMKAENENRKMNGLSLVYDDENFDAEANEIASAISSLKQIGYGA